MQMLKQLEEWHKEEIADSEKYNKMAETSPEEYKCIFRDISKEESIHAHLLEKIIEDYKKHCSCEENDNSVDMPIVNNNNINTSLNL